MSDSERMAIAAHLHVALRRKAGRVTDTEWMAVNDVYAQEVVRIAHAKAAESGDAALAELAHKLQAVLQAKTEVKVKPASTPLVERVAQTWRDNSQNAQDNDNRYVGGLR